MWRWRRNQLGLIFIGFLLLICASAAATFWLMQTQRQDATLINLAGRQRLLVQQMLSLALLQADSPELAAVSNRFEQTLGALRDGGATLDAGEQAVTLLPASDPAVRVRLDEATQTWRSFRAHLRPLDARSLQMETPQLLAELDAVVGALERQTETKIVRLQGLQMAFLAAALVLLAGGYWLTRQRIIYPLAQLNEAARRAGEAYFSGSVPATGDDELGQLAHALDAIGSEVVAMRESLETQVAQRTREVLTAFEFSQEIVQQLDLRELLRSVTDRAYILMHAEAASLCLLGQDGQCLELVSSSSGTAKYAGLRQSARRAFPLRVVGAGETTSAAAECVNCAFMQANAPGQCVAAPLRAGEEILGALCVVRRNGPAFSAEETRALTLLGNAAAIAINNARLAEAGLRQSEENAALAEREKLAAELHDNLAQTLGAINLRIGHIETLLASDRPQEAIEELGEMQTAVKNAYGQVRTALSGLQPPFPGNGNLEEKLVECVTQFRRESGLAAELVVADPEALALPPVTQAQALHIVREALTNVRRHAHAQHVRVSVMRSKSLVKIIIEDDGQGFSPEQSLGDGHLGLVIMRTRAERSGGWFAVYPAPGQGTRVEATFKIAAAEVEVIGVEER
jgi:two-component system nitrate/nitrite sensor histidine kinase NarX